MTTHDNQTNMFRVIRAPKPAEVPVALKEFNPPNFKAKDVKLWTSSVVEQVISKGTNVEGGDEEAGSLLTNKKKHKYLAPMHEAHINYVKQDIGKQIGKVAAQTTEKPFIDVDSKSLVLLTPVAVRTPKVVYVVLEEHKANTRPDGLDYWHHMCLGRNKDGSRHVRWVKMVSMKEGEGGRDQAVAFVNEVGNGRSRYCVKMEIVEQEGRGDLKGLEALVDIMEKGDEDAELVGRATNAVNALLKETSPCAKTSVVFGNKHYPLKSDATVQGVEFRAGIAKSLLLSGSAGEQSKLHLSERQVHQLFLPPTNLARFMTDHFGPACSTLTQASKELMEGVLKNISVRIDTKDAGWVKTITGFSTLTPDQQKVQLRDQSFPVRVSDIYAAQGYATAYPHLPCVDVGTINRPYYVPPEFCSILPDQPFHGGDKACFQREVANLRVRLTPQKDLMESVARELMETPAEDDPKADFGHLVKEPALIHYTRCKPWTMSEIKQVGLLMVEVGKEPLSSAAWPELKQVMGNIATTLYSDSQAWSIARILNADPANATDEPFHLAFPAKSPKLADWKEKLADRLAVSWDREYESPQGPTVEPVVLFGFQDKFNHADIYMSMKKICNQLGVQCVGVRVDKLRKQIMADKSGGLNKYAHELYRKIFARSPLFLAQKRTDSLAVAIAVQKTERPKSVEPFYVVGIVSRQLMHSREYRTTVEAFDKEDSITVKTLQDLLEGHLKKHAFKTGSTPQKIVVFHAGDRWPSSSQPSDSPLERSASPTKGRRTMLEQDEVAAAVHRTLGPDVEVFGIRVSQDNRVGLLMSAEAAIQETIASVKFQELEHTLREPKSIFFRVDHTIAGAKGKDILVTMGSATPADAVFTRLSMLDMKASPNLELPGSKAGVTSRKPSGPVTGFHQSMSPAQQRKRYAMEGDMAQTQAVSKSYPIDDQSFEELARVFHDSLIGLHQCRLPIPLHLAEKAIDWALTHGTKEEVKKKLEEDRSSRTNGADASQVPAKMNGIVNGAVKDAKVEQGEANKAEAEGKSAKYDKITIATPHPNLAATLWYL